MDPILVMDKIHNKEVKMLLNQFHHQLQQLLVMQAR